MSQEVVVNMEAVQAFQKQKNWTDSCLAMHMGVSRALVSRVKSGKRSVAAAFIQGLVKAGMNPSEIFLKN